jgi:hypothetical protein
MLAHVEFFAFEAPEAFISNYSYVFGDRLPVIFARSAESKNVSGKNEGDL